MRVFILDDYIDYAIPLKDRFEFEGHKAMYCLSSDKAVDQAFDFKPDWLVVDVRLPYKSGVLVFKELNERADFEFSVVFYTNYRNDPEVLDEFKDLEIPNAVIIPKTMDLEGDFVDKLIPALQAKKLVGGKKNGK